MFTLLIVAHQEVSFCIGSHALKVDISTCKGVHGAMPLVTIGLVVEANSLLPVFLINQFESRAISSGDEFCWGVARQASKLALGVLLEERNIFIFKLHCLLGTISRTL